jgi:hypothetical protein
LKKFIECTPQEMIDLLTRNERDQLGPKRPLGPEAMALVRARAAKIVPLVNELELAEKKGAAIRAQLDLLQAEFVQQIEVLMPELTTKDWKIDHDEACIQVYGDNGDPQAVGEATIQPGSGPSVH